jgi:hypothetical protein
MGRRPVVVMKSQQQDRLHTLATNSLARGVKIVTVDYNTYTCVPRSVRVVIRRLPQT